MSESENAAEQPTREWLESARGPVGRHVAEPEVDAEVAGEESVQTPDEPQARTLKRLAEAEDA